MAPAFLDPGVLARVCACGRAGVRWGRPGPGKEEGRGGPAGSCLPRQMASAAPPRAAGGGGAVLGGEASPGHPRSCPCDPGRPPRPRRVNGQVLARGLWLVSSVACGPLSGSEGRVVARGWQGDPAARTLRRGVGREREEERGGPDGSRRSRKPWLRVSKLGISC